MPGHGPAHSLRRATATAAEAEAIARLNEARRLPYWRTALAAAGPNQDTLVATDDGGIAGLVSFGLCDPGPLWKSDNILVVWRPDAPG